MPIERLPATANGAEVGAALERDGCAIVERLAPLDLLARVREEAQPYVAATPYGPDEFAGRRTRRTGGLVARSPSCRELIMNPTVLAAVGTVLAKATSFQLHLTQIIGIDPGEPGQMIHRDQWAFDFFPFPAGYEVQCNTIWAMTDFTEGNGATRLVSGRHRQEENQYLSVPAEIARTLPEPLLRLMGYARGAYSLGYVDDLRDPLDALFGTHDAGVAPGDLAAAA